MNNILKVCDDKYCIEVSNTSSNHTTNCAYTIYPSNQSLLESLDMWVIITIPALLFIIILLIIILIMCHCCRKKQLPRSPESYDKLTHQSSHPSTLHQKVSYSPDEEYCAIPDEGWMTLHNGIEEVEHLRSDIPNGNHSPNGDHSPSITFSESSTNNSNSSLPVPLLEIINKSFNAKKGRHSVNLDEMQPMKITKEPKLPTVVPVSLEQIRKRSTIIKFEDSDSAVDEKIHNHNLNVYDPNEVSCADTDDYQFLAYKSTMRNTMRSNTLRSRTREQPYSDEYELNHLESFKGKHDIGIRLFSDHGTQDDMIYKSTDNCYENSRSGFPNLYDSPPKRSPPNKDAFSRLSTIRLIKFFAPQEIKHSDIDFKKQEFIGRGSVGKVYKAKYNGIHVAVKKLNDNDFNLSETDLKNFKREASIMQKVGGHKHIARMYGFCTAPEICIVTEYYSRGSLHDIIKNQQTTLSIERKLQMCIEASLGILHLHQQNVIHRDISARNLLVDENWIVVVADLGMSRLKKSSKHRKDKNPHFGPIKWMAPESITLKEYSEKTDAYSFGITMYEIFSELPPYPSLLPLEAGAKVVAERVRPRIDHLEFMKCVPEIGTLMKTLWEHEPRERPKFRSICESLREIKTDL